MSHSIISGPRLRAAAVAATLFLCGAPHRVGAQTPFTYQGRLDADGAAYTGPARLRLGLWSSASGGSLIRSETLASVSVTDGLFTVTPGTFVPADFALPSGVWLEIEVSTDGGGNWTKLTPRQRVTHAPLAMQAETARTVTGNVATSQLTGTLNPGLLSGGVIVNDLTFSRIGAPFSVNNVNATTVTNLSADKLDGLDSTAFLRTTGGTLTGTLAIAPPAVLDFASTTRQMINLWGGTQYGIGVQTATLYQRSNSAFAWFRGGAHNDAAFNPGVDGTTLMTLDGGGYLETKGTSAGFGLLNRADQAKRWVAYAEGAGSADSFRIWSGTTGDRFTLGQNGNLTVSGTVTAPGFSAFTDANVNGHVVSGVHFTSSGSGAGVYGATGSTAGFAVLGEGAVGGYGGKFVANGAAGWAVYGVSDTGYAGRFSGRLHATGATTLGSTLNVSGAATFVNEVTVQGALAGLAMKNRDDQAKRWVMYARNGGGGDQLTFYSDAAGDVASLTPSGDLTLNGALSTTVLTIRGGADVAEPFPMTQPEEMEPGSVVVIDADNPGRLRLSTRACDPAVAGIVSGAGGVQPGLRLHQEGVMEGDHHVALSGRVYVKADADSGPIRPGDLLTTADRAGHAMKVAHPSEAAGAILGKAMSRLDRGQGLVLVLVSLQ